MSLSHWQQWCPGIAWRVGLTLGFGISGVLAIALPGSAQQSGPVTQPFNQSLSTLSNGTATVDAAAELNYRLLYVHPTQGNDQAQGSVQAPVRSLTQALRLAQPNTVIVLAPGVYSAANGEVFPIQLKPGVTVQGDARTYGQQTVIHGGGSFISPTFAHQNATLLAANYAGLTGVTVTNPNPQGYGLWVESSRAVIMANTFAGSQLDGMAIAGHDRSVVRQNIFTQNRSSGVSVFGTAETELRNNVFQNTGFGVNIAEQSTPTLIGNRILQNRDGIVVQANARPILRTNVIEANQRDGLTVVQLGQPDLGTMAQAGGNIFQANQRLDINAQQSVHAIPAFGNQFTANRVAGQIDATGSAPIALAAAIAPPAPATPAETPSVGTAPAIASPSAPTPTAAPPGNTAAIAIAPAAVPSPVATGASTAEPVAPEAGNAEFRIGAMIAQPTPAVPPAADPALPSETARDGNSTPVPAVASAASPPAEPIAPMAEIEVEVEVEAAPAIAATPPSEASAPAAVAITIPVEPAATTAPTEAAPADHLGTVAVPDAAALPRLTAEATPAPGDRPTPRHTLPQPVETPEDAAAVTAALTADPVTPPPTIALARETPATLPRLERLPSRAARSADSDPAPARVGDRPEAERPAATSQRSDSPAADLTTTIDPTTAVAIAVEAPQATPAAAAGQTVSLLARTNSRPAQIQALAPAQSPGDQAIAIDIPVPPPERTDLPAQQEIAYLDVGSGDRLPVPGMNIPLARGNVPAVNVPINAAWNPNEPPPPPTRATTLGLRYRVIVSALTPAEQQQVKTLVPDAFQVQYNGDMVMQAGAYRDRAEADALVDRLLNTGLHVFVLDASS